MRGAKEVFRAVLIVWKGTAEWRGLFHNNELDLHRRAARPFALGLKTDD